MTLHDIAEWNAVEAVAVWGKTPRGFKSGWDNTMDTAFARCWSHEDAVEAALLFERAWNDEVKS
jgi:hypothetical protein